MISHLSKNRFHAVFPFWLFLLALSYLFFFAHNASAVTQVSLQWAPNTEPELAGYRIFSREQNQSYDYTSPSWEGIDTSCTIYNLDETKTYCFVARAFDTYGNESQDSAEICYDFSTIINQPPSANAGPDQTVNEGQTVSLDGSNSTDPNDAIASYHWAQTGGSAVTLSDPTGAQPTFTAPDIGPAGDALTFELTVTDQGGNQDKDVCIVNVTWQNEPPQANAGPDLTVDEGSVVALDGSSSLDIDDPIAEYLWTQTGGPTVALSDPTAAQPIFTAPTVGTGGASLTFELTVTDAGGLSDTDSCVVNVTRLNQPPTAVVNPNYIETKKGITVKLDGTASMDSDDGISSYQWTQVEGDPVTLADTASASTTFTAPQGGSIGTNLKFKLTVKDSGGLQSTADSSVYVMPDQISTNPPTAGFIYNINKKAATFQDNSNGDNIVSWLWNFGDGETSNEQNPKHRYVKFDNYTVTLTVTDNNGETDSESLTVSVTN